MIRKFQIDSISVGWQLFQLIRFGVQFLTGVFLARGLLSTADIGLYETVVLVGTSASWFWVNGSFQFFISKGHTVENGYLTMWLQLLVLGLMSWGAVLLILPGLQHYLVASENLVFMDWVFWYMLGVALQAPGFLWPYTFLLQQRTGALRMYAVGYGLAWLLAIPGVLWATNSFKTALITWALLQGIGCFSAPFFFNQLRVINLQALWTSFKNSAVLISGSLVSGAIPHVQGFLVKLFSPLDVFAIYAYGARELPLSSIAANALSESSVAQAQNPLRMAADLKRKSLKLMHIIFPISMGLMVLAPFLFTTVYGATFSESAVLFSVFLLLASSRLIFPQALALAYGLHRGLGIISVFEFLVCIGLTAWLLPVWGIVGVGWATVIGFLVEKGCIILLVRIRLKIRPQAYIPVMWWILYSIILWGMCIGFMIS